MKSHLKRIKEYFIPEKDNDYEPHFFRTAALLFLSGVVVVIFVMSVLGFRAVSSGNYAAIVASVLTELTNSDRLLEGKGALKMNPTLAFAAQMKANDMAAKGYFAHTSPEGKNPWYWFGLAGYKFSYAGENLAVNFSDSIDVERAWMNSPTHRANIVNDKYTEIGIAMAQGTYNGQPTMFVVQLFGRPAIAATSTPVAKNISKSFATTTEEKPAFVKTTPPAPPAVLASESETLEGSLEIIVEDETFVAVKQAGTPEPSDASAVEGETAGAASPLLVRLFSSPGTFLQYAYAFIAILIIFALIVDVVVEVRRQHPLHILYATLLLVLVFVLLYIARANMFPDVLVL